MSSEVISDGELEEISPSRGCAISPEQLQAIICQITAEVNKTNPVTIAERILRENQIIYCAEDFYRYESGCYRRFNENELFKIIKDILALEFSWHKAREVITSIKAEAFVKTEILNAINALNLRNGMFDLRDLRLREHSHKIFSTIQLNVAFDPEAKCPMWCTALDQIFLGRMDKISILQEFFGLCLTKDVSHEKALFLIGEGSNGKSVILHVLQHLLGEENYSSVALETFNNSHYIADMFGKLANISMETNAKSSVYDSMFKAIVSGDSIQADAKFKHPLKFRPFCKLIFALNNMPRVDDKTEAFFRRLIILRFDRKFKEHEKNKNLRQELLTELDGIFNWSLDGLMRLRDRGHFMESESVLREIQQYRRQNNNLIIFVEEECNLDQYNEISKDVLYRAYSEWCSQNGYYALSKIHFGKDLMKQFPDVEDNRDAVRRYWSGIGLPEIVTENDRNDEILISPFL